MLPSLFTTQEEITKKLREVAKSHTFRNAQTICHIFYDVFKIAYYALVRKNEGLKAKSTSPLILRRVEVSRLVKLIDYYHNNNVVFTADHELIQCFGDKFTEENAIRFFERHVEGSTKDKFGREIYIDLEDGARFMYKNYETQAHEMKSEYFLPHRGKRLPWIRHTLHNSSNIYTKLDGKDREIMYICRYNLPAYDGEVGKCYWAVIVKKYSKDEVGPYKFKTAFPIFKYNSLLSRLERYQPISENLRL